MLAAVAVAGGAAFALTRFMAPAEDRALSLAPQNSVLYANLFVHPSNDQKMALDDLLQKFPGIENTDDAIDKLIELFDEQLGEQGLSYEEDIEPWLGDQAAVFMTPGGSPQLPNFGVLVESKDDEAIRAFLTKVQEEEDPDGRFVEREHNGTVYEVVEDDPETAAFAFIEGFFVGGTEEAVKASIDARQGEALEDSDKFVQATEDLRDDWLGLFYADISGIFSMFEDEMQMTPEDEALFETFSFEDVPPTAGVVYATSDSIGFESSGGLPKEGPLARFGSFVGAGLLQELPESSWAAFGIPDVGALATGYLDLFESIPGFDRDQIEAQFTDETGLDLDEDVLSWMGDAGLFVQGTNLQEVGGGLVLRSNDPAKTQATLSSIEQLVSEQGLQPRPVSRDGLEGFSLQAPGMPAPVYFLGGERLVITYGETATDAAIAPEAKLADAEMFGVAQDVLGEDVDASFFVDVDAAQSFAESVMSFSGAVDPTYEEDVKPYIEPFAYVIAGTRQEDDRFIQKLVIGVP